MLGSDRPYAEPLESLLGEAATRAMRVDNPYRALGRHPHSGHETADTDGGSGMSVTVLGVPAREATPLAGDLTLDTLPGRDLDQDELRSLASSLALHPELWRHHLAFDDDHRVYVSLYRDAHVDVWLLCWTPENDTGFHDHDISSGAVAVVSGTLARAQPRRRQPRPSRPSSRAARSSASVPTTSTGSSVPSTGRCRSTPTARPCGGWASTPSRPTAGCAGQSVSYADELRPVD